MSDTVAMIKSALDDAVGQPVEITPGTHLTQEALLDSLDSAVFLLNIEKASGVKLSEEAVEQYDLFKVSNLIDYIEKNAAA